MSIIKKIINKIYPEHEEYKKAKLYLDECKKSYEDHSSSYDVDSRDVRLDSLASILTELKHQDDKYRKR